MLMLVIMFRRPLALPLLPLIIVILGESLYHSSSSRKSGAMQAARMTRVTKASLLVMPTPTDDPIA